MFGRPKRLSRWLVMPFLMASLLMSSSGQLLCVDPAGVAAIEPAIGLGACSSDRCGEGTGGPVSVLEGGGDCVDLLLSSLVRIRSERSGSDAGVPPLPLSLWPSIREPDPVRLSGAFAGLSRADRSRAPDADRLRSFILLV